MGNSPEAKFHYGGKKAKSEALKKKKEGLNDVRYLAAKAKEFEKKHPLSKSPEK